MTNIFIRIAAVLLAFILIGESSGAQERTGRTRENRVNAILEAANEIRAASRAAVEAVEAADAQRRTRLAGLTTTSDGKLALDGTSPRTKETVLQAYGGEFVRLAHANMPFVPYGTFTRLLRTRSELCRLSLPENAVRYEHDDKTVWLDPRDQAAYKTAVKAAEDKLWQQWASKPNPLPAFYFNTGEVGLAELDRDTRTIVVSNGCKSIALRKLTDQLRLFVSGDWMKSSPSEYRFADSDGDGAIVRSYQEVPATFSPSFPVPKGGRMKIILDEARRSGLTSLTISLLPPFRGAPAAVEDAIGKRKFFVVQCEYRERDDWSDAFYWNANGPVPSAEVQAFLKNLIREPRTTCPSEYVSRLQSDPDPPAPAPEPVVAMDPEAPPPPVAVAPPPPEPDDEWSDVTIDGEARVRDAIRLEVTPPDALVLVRQPNQQLFLYAGKATQFAAEALELESEVCLILFRKTGWRDRVLKLTIDADGESTLKVTLTK